MTVGRLDGPIPYCVAGRLDSREIRRDGTVLDRQVSARQLSGGWNTTHSVTVYRADGSYVNLVADDQDVARPDFPISGTVPLSAEELVSIGLSPDLALPR